MTNQNKKGLLICCQCVEPEKTISIISFLIKIFIVLGSSEQVIFTTGCRSKWGMWVINSLTGHQSWECEQRLYLRYKSEKIACLLKYDSNLVLTPSTWSYQYTSFPAPDMQIRDKRNNIENLPIHEVWIYLIILLLQYS